MSRYRVSLQWIFFFFFFFFFGGGTHHTLQENRIVIKSLLLDYEDVKFNHFFLSLLRIGAPYNCIVTIGFTLTFFSCWLDWATNIVCFIILVAQNKRKPEVKIFKTLVDRSVHKMLAFPEVWWPNFVFCVLWPQGL